MNATPIDRATKIEAALVELLRLYDWRNELGRIERDFNHDRKQMKTWLNQYGREKKAAWAVAREVLRGGETAIRGSQSSQPRLEGEIPFPATFPGTTCEGMRNVAVRGSAGCRHEWHGPGEMPGRYTCGCGTVVFRSRMDAD